MMFKCKLQITKKPANPNIKITPSCPRHEWLGLIEGVFEEKVIPLKIGKNSYDMTTPP